jgi:Mor family transcriptional regulator
MKLESVAALLPDSVQQIAALIGLAYTLKLVEAFGGTTFPVSKNRRRMGQIRYEALAEVVGVDAADLLTHHYGGDVLAIPKCAQALRELRDRQLRADFDLLTRDAGAVPTVTQLARRYRLTERHVWRLLNQTDRDGGEQGSLWE